MKVLIELTNSNFVSYEVSPSVEEREPRDEYVIKYTTVGIWLRLLDNFEQRQFIPWTAVVRVLQDGDALGLLDVTP